MMPITLVYVCTVIDIEETIRKIIRECKDVFSHYGLRDHIVLLDYVSIFPKSREHEQEIEDVTKKIAVLISKEFRVYKLNNPIQTEFGNAFLLRTRSFEKDKTDKIGYADFKLDDFNVGKELSKKYPEIHMINLDDLNMEMIGIEDTHFLVNIYIPEVTLGEDLGMHKTANSAQQAGSSKQ